MKPELTVVVPTYNEADNIESLVVSVDKALAGVAWEVIFVDDDSPDGTAERVWKLSQRFPQVRCIRRVGRRGLASACIEGMLSSNSPFLAVMDADGQHDESILAAMLKKLKATDIELAVGSRYVAGGDASGGLRQIRLLGSLLATRLSRLVTAAKLSDPMSGYFMLRRELLDRTVHSLYGEGFKILLDIVTSAGAGLKLAEFPYTMKARQVGESKLDSTVVLEFLLLLLNKRLHGWIPLRFGMFLIVGAVGVVVHMLVLYVLFGLFGGTFVWAQGLATWVAMTGNYFLNNSFTYRDRRLQGKRLWQGLLSFYVACGLGAVVNVALAEFLFKHGVSWAFAGLVGAGVGAVWNYVMTSLFTWAQNFPVIKD